VAKTRGNGSDLTAHRTAGLLSGATVPENILSLDFSSISESVNKRVNPDFEAVNEIKKRLINGYYIAD
jgi:hypothetical protein